jgi:lysozyme family protein
MPAFPSLIERVLGHEGGYVNDPRDPGGETQWGISKRAYPHVDIRALSRADAIEIYHRDFWERVHGDELPAAFAFQALDAAVNHGVDTAVRWIQRAAGVADDGHYGPVTRAAIAAASEADLVLRFNAQRLDFYSRLAAWDRFGRGWARRVAGNLLYAAQDNDP